MYVVLGSDANDTPEKALLQLTQSGWSTRSNPHDDTIYNKAYVPGDGTVTRKSLLGTHDLNGNKREFPSAYEIFFTQHHMDNVLHSLLDKTE